ncbi:hypothetical protein FIBSPDRAFT_751247, partial [Athelia psychrophila]
MTRPATSKTGRTCLALYVEVHGVRVYSLFDSGSTSDSVSPDFTQVAKVPTRTLEPPVPLQLGCVGSRSMINFGASARIRVGPIDTEEYFDVVNIDKYDAVIGTPFMVKHKIALDFEKMEIIFAGNQEVFMAIMDANLNEIDEGEHDIPALREAWIDSAADILTGSPASLPPLREVNHKMKLIDEDMEYHYHLPKCPDSLKVTLLEKTEKYTNAGWWEAVNVPSAAPMMCIPK